MTVIDYLTCGGCQTEFPLNNIVTFMEHKKVDCLTSTQLYPTQAVDYGFTNYSCYTCPKKFGAAVSLLQHAQFQHKLNVYISSAVNDIQKTADTVSKNSSSDWHDIHENGRPTTNMTGTPATTCATFTTNNVDNDDTTEISEPLSKCCTSVVPKKRKRHFETKHRSSFFKNSRLKRQVQQSTMPSDIYINLDPSILSTHMRGGMGDPNSGSEGDSQSVLLQPGKTVTIPIPSSDQPSHFRGIIRDANSPSNDASTSGSYQPSSSQDSSNTKEQPVETPERLSPVLSENSHDNSASRKKYPTSKPFKCDHCGDSFNQRIHLKKHLSKHTGVKPYKCGQCDYATVERSHLKVHIRIHTGEKPFKCTYCTYATAQNSTLKIHLKRHHGGALSLECTHCGKFFPEKKQLLSHKEEHGKGAGQ